MSRLKELECVTDVVFDDKHWNRRQLDNYIHWCCIELTHEYKYEDPRDGWLFRKSLGNWWTSCNEPEIETLHKKVVTKYEQP
jgi:hypothetical protein